MGFLPIPADMFFEDFAHDVLEYNILDRDTVISSYRGLANSDEGGAYIGFLMSDQPQISIRNIIRTSDGLESYKVSQIAYDRYEGKAELLKAYY